MDIKNQIQLRVLHFLVTNSCSLTSKHSGGKQKLTKWRKKQKHKSETRPWQFVRQVGYICTKWYQTTLSECFCFFCDGPEAVPICKTFQKTMSDICGVDAKQIMLPFSYSLSNTYWSKQENLNSCKRERLTNPWAKLQL